MHSFSIINIMPGCSYLMSSLYHLTPSETNKIPNPWQLCASIVWCGWVISLIGFISHANTSGIDTQVIVGLTVGVSKADHTCAGIRIHCSYVYHTPHTQNMYYVCGHIATHSKWRRGSDTNLIICWCFDWMLHLSSEWKWRSVNTRCHI